MTTEIAISNKEAVALAADSAVTTSNKIFTSADKLFNLSYSIPVGIMVYGNASFMGVPWEIIIKLYRKNLDSNKFNTVTEYGEDFISYLSNGDFFPLEIQKDIYLSKIENLFSKIVENISFEIESETDQKNKQLTDSDISSIVSTKILYFLNKFKKAQNYYNGLDDKFGDKVVSKYKKDIQVTINKQFEKIPIKPKDMNELFTITNLFCSRYINDDLTYGSSGIVLAGFGEKNIFPKIFVVQFVDVIENKVRYLKRQLIEVNHNLIATIVPFAQRDEIQVFMDGVSSIYNETVKGGVSVLLHQYTEKVVSSLDKYNKSEKKKLKNKLNKINERLLKTFWDITDTIKSKRSSSIATVVSTLPKNELALMAEALINLTSFKRRISMEEETVGGPIDVAVISKNDGFIWIKRKHYFKPELNPHYFSKFNKEKDNEKT